MILRLSGIAWGRDWLRRSCWTAPPPNLAEMPLRLFCIRNLPAVPHAAGTCELGHSSETRQPQITGSVAAECFLLPVTRSGAVAAHHLRRRACISLEPKHACARPRANACNRESGAGGTTRAGTPTRAAVPKRSWCFAFHQIRNQRTGPARG
jgi:hypothetical protein